MTTVTGFTALFRTIQMLNTLWAFPVCHTLLPVLISSYVFPCLANQRYAFLKYFS